MQKRRTTSGAAVEAVGPRSLKPRLRGRFHQVAFFLSIPAGITLVALAQGTKARVAATIFAASLCGLYGVSAAYHRGQWTVGAERLMKRLDHSMIFILIAGSYTPVTLLALPWALGITLLALVWTGAVIGILITVLQRERWRNVGFAMYIVLGWFAVVAIPQLTRSLSRVEMALLAAGGLLYTVGAVVLARKRPDPNPAVFGYHEIWHAFVIAASSCHFVLILLLVRA